MFSSDQPNPNPQGQQVQPTPAGNTNPNAAGQNDQAQELPDNGGLNEWGDIPASPLGPEDAIPNSQDNSGSDSDMSLTGNDSDTDVSDSDQASSSSTNLLNTINFTDLSANDMNSQAEDDDIDDGHLSSSSSSSTSIKLPTSSLVKFAFTGSINNLRNLFKGPLAALLSNLLNQINPQTRKTLLMQKASNGNSAYVKLFLDNNADPNIKNVNGWTAINYAIDNDLESHGKCLKILASCHKTNLETETLRSHSKPLLITIKKIEPNYSKFVQILLQNGADSSITDQNQENNSLLQLTLQQLMKNKIFSASINLSESRLENIIKNILRKITLLLEHGINLQHKNNAQKTAMNILQEVELSWQNNQFYVPDTIQTAVKTALEKIKSLLLEENLNLHTAAASGLIGLMKTIIQAKQSEVYFLNLAQNTPLHLAVLNGQEEAAELLLLNKANVHAKNIRGKTPLHFAAQKSFTPLCSLLIQHGADLNDADLNRQTPLLIAKEIKNIPLFIFFTKINLEKSETICPICSDPLENNQDYWILECGHTLHTECVADFEKINNRCPFCRNPINLELICSGRYGEMNQLLGTKKHKHDKESSSSSSSNQKAEKKDQK